MATPPRPRRPRRRCHRRHAFCKPSATQKHSEGKTKSKGYSTEPTEHCKEYNRKPQHAGKEGESSQQREGLPEARLCFLGAGLLGDNSSQDEMLLLSLSFFAPTQMAVPTMIKTSPATDRNSGKGSSGSADAPPPRRLINFGSRNEPMAVNTRARELQIRTANEMSDPATADTKTTELS